MDKILRGLIIGILLLSMLCTDAFAFTVEMTKQQVQDAVERYFPVKHVTPFATFNLYSPVVFLDNKSNRIGLEISTGVDVSGLLESSGKCMFDGDLEYRKEGGEFYLHDPKMRHLEVNSVPAEINASIHQVLQEFIRQSLPVMLVYKLKGDDVDQRIAKDLLSSVTVRKGKVIIELLPFFPEI